MLPDKITLEIVTPDRLILSEQVTDVVLPSVDGYMGVRPGHAPLLCLLDVGQVSYRTAKEEKFYAVSGGFAEVLRDGVEILAETCEPADEIDVQRAQRAKERAEARLAAQTADTDFKRAEISLEKAVCRIQTHQRSSG